MKINKIIRQSVLSDDEILNIKGGVDIQHYEPSGCTDCNCIGGNHNG